ncbi:MAG: DUF169 domain-containing protein [Candidatus Riflebacteria bacterium]|nr:DUF169 domain-containing protein [Candidatus Riflebacteria bacterium]
METHVRERFETLWGKYFTGQPLPLAFAFTDDASPALVPPAKSWSCVLAQIARALKGEDVALASESIGCLGGKRYFGFTRETMPDFEYFLSCGIPGKLEGERYKKTPEIVKEIMAAQPTFEAPARHLVFKRWDRLRVSDAPAAVVFFAPPDVLSGLFTLAGFDETDPHSVIAPFGAGCGTIVQHPCLEATRPRPRAVLGMFDVSARPFVPAGTLSFAIPWVKFERMVGNMEESFLITSSWARVHRRIAGAQDQTTHVPAVAGPGHDSGSSR